MFALETMDSYETGLFDKIAPTKTIRVKNVDALDQPEAWTSNLQCESTLTSSMQKSPSPNKMSASSFQSMVNLNKAEDQVCSQDSGSMTVVIHPKLVDSAAEEDDYDDIPEIDGVGRYINADISAEFKLSNR